MKDRREITMTRQRGMVSILVTMIMMLVISLIVLGFAQVSRREQRQQLDRNLSSEAYYAAESGVNDALQNIKQVTTGTDLEQTVCPTKTSSGPAKYLNIPLNPDLATDVGYTCLSVTTSSLTDVQLPGIPTSGGSSVAPIHPGGSAPNPLRYLKLFWNVPSGYGGPTSPAPCPGTTTFKTVGGYGACPYGVLRIDLVPTRTAAGVNLLTRTDLQNQKTVFLYPKNGGSGTATYATMDGSVQPLNCTNSGCTELIDLGAANTYLDYSLRAMAVYKSGDLKIQGLDLGKAPQLLKDAQVQIDVTGKAQDVLRRIQVRIPLLKQGKPSNYALESASSICKRFRVGNDYYDVPADIALKNDTINPTCQPVSPPPAAAPVPAPGLGPVASPGKPVPAPKCAIGYDIILALDHSGSMYDANVGKSQRIKYLQQVMTNFVQNTNVGNLPSQNHEGIIWFAGGYNDLFFTQSPGQTLTGDPTALIKSINTISRGGGTTYQPPMLTVQQEGWNTKLGARPASKKVLVFVTDGLDEVAGDEAKAIAIADSLRKDQGVTVYAIGISDNATYFPGLMSIANQPSKTYFIDATQESDLDAMFNQIAAGIQCK